MSSNLIYIPVQRGGFLDPNIDDVKAYLKFEGQAIVDSVGASAITANGVTITNQNPLVGEGSALFAGAANQAVYVESGVAPGARDFTLEAYMQFDKYSGNGGQGIFDMRVSSNANAFGLGYDNGFFNLHQNGKTFFNNAAPVVLGKKHHVAVVCKDKVMSLFFDGKLIGSGLSSGLNATSRIMLGGVYSSTGYKFVGKMDEVLYSVGVARYVSEFEAPTGPLLV